MAETCNTCVSCRHELFERRRREIDPFFEKWQSSTFNLFQEAIFVKLLEVSGAIRVLNQLRKTVLLETDGDADGDADGDDDDDDDDADADEDDSENDFGEGHADPRATVALFD
ncbi:hypothetical protein BS50DRAFT_567345 [Corynespora cassiicola Philippines]|uniref:Uncharacterized protein n=1 Tax=Corynespora cassiicola Philippines TaxID=1448308 RepID=A0A2T2PA29_CORCC|nr:hypothetical protein BS50DRAFT_567345 [Corynespora cassiicola Philippines]